MQSKEAIADYFRGLQDRICQALETADGKARFHEDLWDREEGGGGRTRVISGGKHLEKGGVNFSAVWGPTPEKILEALELEKANFFATGVSIVIHPRSPRMPIIHMNVRYFEMDNGTFWFGGGIDLTPIYVDTQIAAQFHQKLKAVCDRHGSGYYQEFKQWADDYFYIKHRDETRGVGGIFFDKLNTDSRGKSQEELFAFVKDVGEAFAPLYTTIMAQTQDLPYGEDEIRWQKLRRGRYVEFNLVYDKGTKFGLDTNGRTESILMSMPPEAGWEYMAIPEEGSAEAQTLALLKKNLNWLEMSDSVPC